MNVLLGNFFYHIFKIFFFKSGWVIIPLEMKDQQPCCKVIYIQQVDITVGFEQKISVK